MPQSMMGSVSGLSIASRTSRTSQMSRARSVASVATLTSTMHKKTGLRFPILEYAGFTDVQRGSVLSALYTSVSGSSKSSPGTCFLSLFILKLLNCVFFSSNHCINI